MRNRLKLLSEQFPHAQRQMLQLFGQDEGFRDLCEEYEACVDALARLEAVRPVDDPIRLEYAALKLRLEGELLRYLEAHQAP